MLDRERVIVRREPLMDKLCPVCGRAFRGLARQRYCSRPCRYRADYDRHAQQRRASQRQRYRRKQSEPKE